MINIDTRLLSVLNGFEIAVFMHLVKRINSENKCFPSRDLLKKETGFGREKLAETIKGLIEKNILSTYQEKEKAGKFSKTIYKIETDLAGIYVNSLGKELKYNGNTENRLTENRNRDTENRLTEIPLTEKSTLSINQSLSINHIKDSAPPKKSISSIEKSKNVLTLEVQTIRSKFAQTDLENKYIDLVNFILGKNNLGLELSAVLRTENQITFKQFETLNKAGLDLGTLCQMLYSFENTPKYQDKKSIYLTFLNWNKRDTKRKIA